MGKYDDRPNLVRLAQEISSSEHPEAVMQALACVVHQDNNQKFNDLLNSCQDPRRTYNALQALVPVARAKPQSDLLAEIAQEARETFPEWFEDKSDREIIREIGTAVRKGKEAGLL